MSHAASAAVWRADVRPAPLKLCALALADWCNATSGELFPSMQAIAGKIGVSRSQAQRLMRQLIDDGLVTVVANAGGGKPGTTPRYRLNLERFASMPQTGRVDATPTGSTDATPTDSADATPTGRTDATGSVDATGRMDAQEGSHGCDGRGSADAALTGIYPLKNRNSQRANARKSAAAKAKSQSATPNTGAEHPLFGEFWSGYPRHEKRKDAAKAFAKIDPTRQVLDAMLTAIDAQGLHAKCQRGEGRFVPHPSTWLNGERWKDEQRSGGASPFIGDQTGRVGNGVAL